MSSEKTLFYEAVVQGMTFKAFFGMGNGPLLVVSNSKSGREWSVPLLRAEIHQLTPHPGSFEPATPTTCAVETSEETRSGWWITDAHHEGAIDINHLSDAERADLQRKFGLSLERRGKRYAFSESEAFSALCEWVMKNPGIAKEIVHGQHEYYFLNWLYTDFRPHCEALGRDAGKAATIQ
jgi:hypothetical protein